MLLALGALIAAATVAASPPGAVARAAEDVARAATEGLSPSIVAVAVAAPAAEPLRSTFETALAGALAARGHSVLPLRAGEPSAHEAEARSAGAEALVRARPALVGASLVVSVEVVPTRPNFFLQGRSSARPAGSRVLTFTTPADEATRALAGARPARRRVSLRPLADLAAPVLALAAGATGGARVRLVAVTPGAVLLLDERGAPLSSYAWPPWPPGPRPRDLLAAVAVGDFGAGRIGYAVAGGAGAEVLGAEGDRLVRAGALAAAPLAAGAAGALYGRPDARRGEFRALSRDAAAPADERGAALPAAALGAAAAPVPGHSAFAVLDAAYVLHLVGAGLERAYPPIAGVGVGFALADVDGDGEPEVVASSASPGPPDRVRVLRPGSTVDTAFTSDPLPGTVLAVAAGDVTGDGIDDAVLAAALPGGGTRLWLLTADPRGLTP